MNLPLSEFLFELGVHMLTTAWKIFLLPSQRSDKNDGVTFPRDSVKKHSFKSIH